MYIGGDVIFSRSVDTKSSIRNIREDNVQIAHTTLGDDCNQVVTLIVFLYSMMNQDMNSRGTKTLDL